MAHSVSASASDYCQSMTQLLRQLDYAAIDAYAQLLFDAWQQQRRILVFGNGGSAFTAAHHVLDYAKTAAVPGQRRLQAISLVDNIGLTTAIGNDVSYDDTFRYPLETFAAPGDIAVAISCSGNSPNVIAACEWARQNGVTVVALTGFSGGKLTTLADLHINVSSDNYGIVEDLHMSIGHIVAQILQQRVRKVASAA